ncbi:MAG TPA: methyltransferase domain-containing protein [Candidatus Limnocylindria bacterium]|jgi:SAM-dependent methyltransferase|nr:methyltransferase domain-containing protein [Candidatus Limnocylindria bacterium]
MDSPANVEYALENAWDNASRRLNGIEATYDPITRRRLSALGLGRGWACLEVGAGAGSVARWMSAQVGSEGTVVAADLDTRLLTEMPENVQVRRLDLRADELPEAAFDLIHTRLVLGHLPDPGLVLDKLVSALRPGGWLLLEEADSIGSDVVDEEGKAHADAMRASFDALTVVGDVDLGRKLPRMVRERGLGEVGVECEVSFLEGGAPELGWLGLSFDQLNARSAEPILDQDTVDRWKDLLAQPGRWLPALGIIATRARRAS